VSEPAVPESPAVPEPPASWAEHLSRWRPPLPLSVPGPAAVGPVVIVVVVALLVVAAVLFIRRSPPPPSLSLPHAGGGATPAGEQPAAAGGPAPAANTQLATATVTVHAAGAVVRAGVYVLPATARVADALAAAGGTMAEANVDQLNLAAKLVDAQRIYVPRRGEAPPPAEAAAGTGPAAAGTPGAPGAPAEPIDLNAATAAQLDVLPGVGPATSQAIVAYRTKHGPFRSVSDLLSVPGIGPAKLDAIRPLVRVSA